MRRAQVTARQYEGVRTHLREVELAALALTGVVEYGLLSDGWEVRARELAARLRVLVMDYKPEEEVLNYVGRRAKAGKKSVTANGTEADPYGMTTKGNDKQKGSVVDG